MKKIVILVLVAFSVLLSVSSVMAYARGDENDCKNLLSLATTDSRTTGDPFANRIPLRNSNIPGIFLIPGGRIIYPVVEILNGTSDDQKTAMGDLIGYLGSPDLSDCNFKVADKNRPCPAGAITFKLTFRKSVGQIENTQSSTNSESSRYANRKWSDTRRDSDSFSMKNQTTVVSFAISGESYLNGFLVMGLPDLLSQDAQTTVREYHEAWLRACGSSDRHGSSNFETSGSRSETTRTSTEHSVNMSTIATLGDGVPRAAGALLSIIVDKDNMDNVKNGLINLPVAETVVDTVSPEVSISTVEEVYTGNPDYIAR